MNTFPDTRWNRDEDQIDPIHREPDPALAPAVIDLGRVSDTRGGWLGVKLDVGAGFIPY